MIEKRTDARRYHRRKMNIVGLIVPGNRPCKIWDISQKGAKLAILGEENVPEKFELWLRKDGSVRRHCRFVWRVGQNVGVSFP